MPLTTSCSESQSSPNSYCGSRDRFWLPILWRLLSCKCKRSEATWCVLYVYEDEHSHSYFADSMLRSLLYSHLSESLTGQLRIIVWHSSLIFFFSTQACRLYAHTVKCLDSWRRTNTTSTWKIVPCSSPWRIRGKLNLQPSSYLLILVFHRWMAIRLDFCGAIMVFSVNILAFRPSKNFICFSLPPGGTFCSTRRFRD